MRGAFAAAVAMLLLAGCSQLGHAHPDEFEGMGRIRGTFSLGDRVLHEGWVEMIELTGPPRERCGAGDCGFAVDALLDGVYWNPGRWQLVPPRVSGWKSPTPLVVVVEAGKLTTVTASYGPL
jgi:hypothetical protein